MYIKNAKFVDKKKNKAYLNYSNKLKNIYDTYVEFVKTNGLSVFDNNIENEDFNIICNYTKDYIDDEDNKSNNNDDELEEDSDNIINYNNSDYHDNDNEGGDDDGGGLSGDNVCDIIIDNNAYNS